MIRIAAAIILAGGAALTSPSWSQSFDAKARALDGDTVAVDFRLLGVDAFERGQLCRRASGCWQCGKAAQDFARLTDAAEVAAMKKDGAGFSAAANGLGDTCTACHSKYKAQAGG